MSEARRIRRIVVAFDASPASRCALKAAAHRAEILQAELLGLFVEDINLVRLAGLPFARAYAVGGQCALDTAAMELSLSEHARRAEDAMTEIAHMMRIPWSFRSTRGRIEYELMAAAVDAEMIALGTISAGPGRIRLGSTARALLASCGQSLLLAAPEAISHGPVACLYDGTDCGDTAIRQAAEHAGTGELVVFLAGRDKSHCAEHRANAEQIVDGTPANAHFIQFTMRDIDTMANTILAVKPSMIVMPRTFLDTDALNDLLCRLDTIVLLTGKRSG